jgi:TATA-binding protein-associated factor Taf7
MERASSKVPSGMESDPTQAAASSTSPSSSASFFLLDLLFPLPLNRKNLDCLADGVKVEEEEEMNEGDDVCTMELLDEADRGDGSLSGVSDPCVCERGFEGGGWGAEREEEDEEEEEEDERKKAIVLLLRPSPGLPSECGEDAIVVVSSH